MAFGSFDNKGTNHTVSEINMVPLIDVMLVLLVIFIITAPLLSHSIKINVPQASSAARRARAQNHRSGGRRARPIVLERAGHNRQIN